MNLFMGYAASIEGIIAAVNSAKSKGLRPDYKGICRTYGYSSLDAFTEDELEYIERNIGE